VATVRFAFNQHFNLRRIGNNVVFVPIFQRGVANVIKLCMAPASSVMPAAAFFDWFLLLHCHD
jgi:hypothetical protein